MTLFDEPIISEDDCKKDCFQTPPMALKPLYEFVHQTWRRAVVWEPCCGEGSIVNTLNNSIHGIDCIGTDLLDGKDFLTYDADFDYDYIITNPPYSKTDEFLDRAYSLRKPFAFLLPLTALGGVRRQDMYRKHGMEIIMLGRRINFKTPTGKTHGGGSCAQFEVAWFTHRLHIGKQIIFAQVGRK